MLGAGAAANVSDAGTPQQLPETGVEATAKDTSSSETGLYQGRTFSQWQVSLESDLDTDFRDLALQALGTFGAKGRAAEAIQAIQPYLTSPDANTARVAINSIGHCGPKSAPILAALLDDADYAHRDYAAIALVVHMGTAAKGYAPLLIAMAQSEDDRIAQAGGRALILLGEVNGDGMTAIESVLRRYAKPRRGAANNLAANSFMAAFKTSRMSTAAKDQLFLDLLASEDPFEKSLGGRLLGRYGSGEDHTKQALVREYRTQLESRNVRRLQPSFHDLADNAFLLTCHLDAMSELELSSKPPKPFLSQFLFDLKNMRHRHDRSRHDRRQGTANPSGDLNPARHPGTLPFLIRLLEQQSTEEHPPATLRVAVELLGDFGEDAQEALPTLVALRGKLERDTIRRTALLEKVVGESIDAISPEREP